MYENNYEPSVYKHGNLRVTTLNLGNNVENFERKNLQDIHIRASLTGLQKSTTTIGEGYDFFFNDVRLELKVI